ncbi:MAG: sodium-dependent transporter [Schwartzia sp.]|nr:sodium-dependent transporter [Schwartzia sp. (in: firmicutes)]MBQ9634400.1 sodium-dependent transporter [Schwartzia sp. (in: firmicutes)]
MEKKQNSFSGTAGFILAAAGSAIGLGNIWRFPYFAAKNGGGIFLATYLVLLLTFGITLLITEISIGRKTKHSPLRAYGSIHPRWRWIGIFSTLVPFIILPYYCVIGGWVLKYFTVFLCGDLGHAVDAGYFGAYITGMVQPLVFMAVYIFLTAFVIYRGVNEGIEKMSCKLMPILLLLVIAIAIFCLFIRYDDGTVTRTGLDGLWIYLVPDMSGMTAGKFFSVVLDAMGQLFFSISVAMGIMIAYGSYFDDRGNIFRSAAQIEFFDTFVAFLAGVMIILPVYVFLGKEAMSASGPSLLFVSMPKVFNAMGTIGHVVGAAFFLMVFFAALTSSISIMEAVISSLMEAFSWSREKATVIEGLVALAIGVLVCLGYNVLYFEMPLPNGATGQILDLFDFFSNNIFMPVVAIATCLLIGWGVNPGVVIEEMTKNGEPFRFKGVYSVMIRYIVPFLLLVLFLQSVGILKV